MREGFGVGVEAVVEDTVAESMRARFGSHVIHEVYGTAAMVYHMEWAARRVILPYLEADEEGIGAGVQVRHLHPAPVGAAIRARAVCTTYEGSRVVCAVQVWRGDTLLGDGVVEQRVVHREMLHRRYPDCWPAEPTSDGRPLARLAGDRR
ncbi:thioesterase family protein [Alicyclobacillus herbarius]|uniref:thioesterase family protein n=1 Tax=Alicyclobacillus herbarius TaxID=122960 RepID=UPI00042349C7|nr:hotdog domain-containing protein [Alicyclobacillus herbarius]